MRQVLSDALWFLGRVLRLLAELVFRPRFPR
jgi:hypothetical protein